MNSAATKEMRKDVKRYVDKADDKVVKMFYAMMEAEQEDDWWINCLKKCRMKLIKP